MSEPWAIKRLGDITTKIGSGSTPRGGEAVYRAEGVPFIRSMNVHFAGFKRDGLVYLDVSQAEKLANVTVQAHDVLLNITGASIGRVTTAPTELTGGRVNQHVCIIRPTPDLDPRFLAYYLSSPREQERVLNVQVGATRQALTKAMVENWRVPVPPRGLQQEIVADLDEQLSRLDVGIAALRRARANLKRYRAAVLMAGCEGQLVSTEAELARQQGRDYESGSQLLRRIGQDRRESWRGRGSYVEPSALTSPTTELPEGWALVS